MDFELIWHWFDYLEGNQSYTKCGGGELVPEK